MQTIEQSTELRLWRRTQVSERTGLSRTNIYKLARLGRFPRPVKIADRASAWRSDEVEAWIRARCAEAERQP